jgi:electron transfer flavoprotein beta subunit
LSGVPRRFGEIDKSVVEAAVQVKEACGGTTEIMCFGPEGASASVKELLAIGADEATIVEDHLATSANARVTARVLDLAIRKRGDFDLIVCGFASDDGYSYQTGPRLAERLGLPFISYVCEMTIEGGKLKADRELEDRVQTVNVDLPAVISIAEGAYQARSVTLLQTMRAQKQPLARWEIEQDLGFGKADLADAAGCELVSEDGLIVERKRKMLQGRTLEELADLLIDALVSEDVLATRGGV